VLKFFVNPDDGTHFFEEMGSNFLIFRLRHVYETVTGYVYICRGRSERRHTMLFLVWMVLLLLIGLGTFISTQLNTHFTEEGF
jgi:hypothetical protein